MQKSRIILVSILSVFAVVGVVLVIVVFAINPNMLGGSSSDKSPSLSSIKNRLTAYAQEESIDMQLYNDNDASLQSFIAANALSLTHYYADQYRAGMENLREVLVGTIQGPPFEGFNALIPVILIAVYENSEAANYMYELANSLENAVAIVMSGLYQNIGYEHYVYKSGNTVAYGNKNVMLKAYPSAIPATLEPIPCRGADAQFNDIVNKFDDRGYIHTLSSERNASIASMNVELEGLGLPVMKYFDALIKCGRDSNDLIVAEDEVVNVFKFESNEDAQRAAAIQAGSSFYSTLHHLGNTVNGSAIVVRVVGNYVVSGISESVDAMASIIQAA